MNELWVIFGKMGIISEILSIQNVWHVYDNIGFMLVSSGIIISMRFNLKISSLR